MWLSWALVMGIPAFSVELSAKTLDWIVEQFSARFFFQFHLFFPNVNCSQDTNSNMRTASIPAAINQLMDKMDERAKRLRRISLTEMNVTQLAEINTADIKHYQKKKRKKTKIYFHLS